LRSIGLLTVNRPGAFSAYRVGPCERSSAEKQLMIQYIALQNDEMGNGPLKQYFIGESMHGSEAGILYVLPLRKRAIIDAQCREHVPRRRQDFVLGAGQ
jgi:hypothetical protein